MRFARDTAHELGLTRRTFLRASAATAGGLLLSLYVDLPALAQEGNPAPKVYPPEAFVRIGADGRIVITVNRLEFGQGVQTALPMILADELDADWSQVVAELAPAADVYRDPLFGLQMTGGSRWQVRPDECRAANSVVYGSGSRTARYAELADDAARQPVPDKVRLKNPSEFGLIGKRVRRLDSRAKCDGSQKFALDLDVPGMKIAVVARPPVFGGRVKSFDDKEARGIAGLRDVFEIPLVKGTGVAVVADRFWAAKQARDRLKIEWDLSGVERPDSSELRRRYKKLARTAGKVAVSRGDEKAMGRIPAANRIVAEYEFPYLAHAAMEPLNATIRFDGDRAEAWIPTQFQTLDQAAIGAILGLKPEQVALHTEYAGGAFGRRGSLDLDVPRETAAVAKGMRGTPVKLVWTREDDMQGGRYRPMFVHHVEVGIGKDGMPAAWKHVVVGQSFMVGSGNAFEQFLVKDGVDVLTVEGTADTYYSIPNFHVSHAQFVRDGDADRRAGSARKNRPHRVSPQAARPRRPQAARRAHPAATTERVAQQASARTRDGNRVQPVSRYGRRVRGRGLDRGQAAEDPSRDCYDRLRPGREPAVDRKPGSGRDRFRPDAADGERRDHAEGRPGGAVELQRLQAALHRRCAGRHRCVHRPEHRSSYRGRRASGAGDLAGGGQCSGQADRKAVSRVAARECLVVWIKSNPSLWRSRTRFCADAEPRSIRSRTTMMAKNFLIPVDMKSRVFGKPSNCSLVCASRNGLIRSETNRSSISMPPWAPIKSP